MSIVNSYARTLFGGSVWVQQIIVQFRLQLHVDNSAF